MSILSQSNVKYNKSARVWETWPETETYETAMIIGDIEVFPPGIEGKRAALLADLTQSPEIFQWLTGFLAEHQDNPKIMDRAIRAGHLMREGAVKLLHLEHFEVQSQSEPGGSYTVAKYPSGWVCMCQDWHNGQAYYRWHLDRRSYAPWIEDHGGPCCKHIIAAIGSQALDPYEPCPLCEGKAFLGFVVEATGRIVAQPCEVCQATGAYRVLEIPF